MKIDFRNIETLNIEGEKKSLNISKDLGNAIFGKTADIGELELAREIYKQGEIEVDSEKAVIISKYISENFLAFVKESICPQLEEIISQK